MTLFDELKASRKKCNISQQRLAQMADVSLATVQNIESGKCNPEMSTLLAICNALGMKLLLAPASLDWTSFGGLGVPLLDLSGRPINKKAISEKKNSADIYEILQRNAGAIATLTRVGREETALANWLWAIKDHYPRVWQRVPPIVQQWLADRPPEIWKIKLRRLALAQLAEFL